MLAVAAICSPIRGLIAPYAATALSLGETPAATVAELTLAETIPLGEAKGRLDHMAIDPRHERLFVAELANNSLAVIDLKAGKLAQRITGLSAPQGVAYAPETDRLFIANGGSGVVQMRKGDDLALVGEIFIGDDADNIRLDGPERIIVGYGGGALAVLDAATGDKIGDMPLAAHPEAFLPAPGGDRIFVNEPRALRTAVIARASGRETARWAAPGAAANFAMALDAAGRRLFVVYRMPAQIAAFDTSSGALLSQLATCRDADDVFHDAARDRVYVICGEGAVAVLDASQGGLHELSRLQTRLGARTGLFAPERDRLFVAVPAHAGRPAEIRAYRPK
jgi:DNA-binding beta-propeller fold protein YncE